MTEAAGLRQMASQRGMMLLALLACVAVAGCDKASQKSETAAPATGASAPAAVSGQPTIAIATPIEKETGYAWIVKTDVNPATRKLRVFEGDKELGPGDSIHEDVRKKGLGAYSHWDAGAQGFLVYFSTSDNSDPNTNGRAYTLR